MEPFLAKGEELIKQGHTVGFCFPIQFKSLALEVSPHFFPQDKSFMELVDSPEVRKVIGQVGSGLSRIKTMIQLMKTTKPIQQQMILDQFSAFDVFQPDQAISHIKCIYPILWAITSKGTLSILSPMPCLIHPVHHEPHIGFGSPGPKWWNLFTYWLAERALVHTSVLGYGKTFIKSMGWKISARTLKTFLRNTVHVEYAISEKLFQKPTYWPPQAEITHFRERDKISHSKIDPALIQFLEKYPKPLFISFGSMVNSQPKKVGVDILRVCEKLGQPVVISSSWGGIELPSEIPSYAFHVNDVPYDFLLPNVCAIVHHGGSGTTHSALRCGIPQAIIPHIGDQFFWARQVELQQKGLNGFLIKKWSEIEFEKLIKKLLPLDKPIKD